MQIRPISYADILRAPNAQRLIDAYAAECSIPEIGEINPQGHIYQALEHSHVMQCFGVYEDDNLIGFASLLISVLPHYGRLVATLESIFVLPEHRHGGVGRTLMLAIEQHADAHGCTAILYSAPVNSRFDKFLKKSEGYRHCSDVFVRRLN